MSNCEDFYLDWISPGKRKRKKKLTEKKTTVKHKNIIIKTEEEIQKKKKKKKKIKPKFKGALGENTTEKKKRKSLLKLNDWGSGHVAKSKVSDPHITDHLTLVSKKKRKKKVAFDLSPGYICAKHPKPVCSSLKVNVLPEKEAVTDITGCQVVKAKLSQTQSHDIDSQCTSDDINSQDLFITQKTFRTFSSEPSSGEASDKAVDKTSQQTMTYQKVMQNSPVFKIKYSGGSNTHLQDACFPLPPNKEKQSLVKEKAALVLQEEDGFEQDLKKPMELNTKVIEEKKMYRTVPMKIRTVNPYLDNPVMVKSSLDCAKFSTLSQEFPLCGPNTNRPFLHLQTSKASISTQTENFFTAEFSSYLSFCQKHFYLETLQPLDLSLPQRTRKDLERCFSETSEVKVDKKQRCKQKASSIPGDMKRSRHKHPSLQSSYFSEEKAELKTEPAVRQQCCISTEHKGQIVTSPQPESKSGDATSSEDNEPSFRPGKVDLTQVKAVQMRLNESFFFKTKGDRQSPRAESPLMKLVQSRGMKNRKCR
ncbi:uncharacterized protein si:ch211-176l24.4 [Betta splendens]|uniref:Uncharacterized protein si:ch211-176l24.4 n=1 Tax=Betta splendens TaxID=158456 RepID=A0A6P7MW69_BETSP|nr:uncharacterized protein si:ch211-176l24.4 [Betta splendens]XP_055365815.1 uncharacterized protein si:ch211-176l24.4 [Betta splendens]